MANNKSEFQGNINLNVDADNAQQALDILNKKAKNLELTLLSLYKTTQSVPNMSKYKKALEEQISVLDRLIKDTNEISETTTEETLSMVQTVLMKKISFWR